jgi:hypothetical protein
VILVAMVARDQVIAQNALLIAVNKSKLSFRSKLINSRANIQERLNKILLEFDGDIDLLRLNIKQKLNETWYWGDINTKNYLMGNMYGNKVLNYLLWRYEDFLQSKGYKIKNFTIEYEQIEHISPQKPTNQETIKSGYDVDENNEYSEEFISNYLNCIGNLILISGSHNASIGNKPFKEKLDSYNKNPLLNQQAEIKDFAEVENGEYVWKKESIKKRQEKIVKFALETWSF